MVLLNDCNTSVTHVFVWTWIEQKERNVCSCAVSSLAKTPSFIYLFFVLVEIPQLYRKTSMGKYALLE